MRRRGKVLAIAAAILLTTVPRVARARGCSEVSNIVGYEKCHRYASGWTTDVPRISLSVDFSEITFDPSGHTVDVSQDKKMIGSFSGRALGAPRLAAFGGGYRIDGYVGGPIYLGLQNQIVFGSNSVRNLTPSGAATGGSSSSTMNSLAWLGIVGVRVPLGRVSLRLESAMGGTTVSLDVAGATGSMAAWTVRPRALLDVWVAPNITMSAYAGTDALDWNDRSAGLTLAWHTRAFDGAFALW